MNKKDVFYVRGNLVSLNLVLGLMDSAESPQDAYQWATSGLIHACRTKDDELCDYIEHSLYEQGYRPYQSEEEMEEEDDEPTPPSDDDESTIQSGEDEPTIPQDATLVSSGQTVIHFSGIMNGEQPVARGGLMSSSRGQSESVVRIKLKMVLEELFAMKDDKGNLLFCQKNHWWVVYRLFIDHRVLNIRENKYEQFIDLINSLEVGNMEVELNKTTLSNISQEEIYRKPFVKWTMPTGKRKVTAFNRMYEIATRLNRLLTESLKG